MLSSSSGRAGTPTSSSAAPSHSLPGSEDVRSLRRSSSVGGASGHRERRRSDWNGWYRSRMGKR